MKTLSLLGGLILATGAQPAAAQSATEVDTGSRIAVPARARISDDTVGNKVERARIVMAQFARCVTDREARKVAHAVTLPFGPEFNAAVGPLATDECLGNGEMRFKPIAMRGPLFAELYRRRVIAEAKGRPWDVTAPKISFANAPSADEDVREQLALLHLGDCVVRGDEAGARKVVLAPTASQSQDEAIKQLVPAIGPCVPRGSTIKLGKQVIEAMLAEVLYRGVEPVGAATTSSEKK